MVPTGLARLNRVIIIAHAQYLPSTTGLTPPQYSSLFCDLLFISVQSVLFGTDTDLRSSETCPFKLFHVIWYCRHEA